MSALLMTGGCIYDDVEELPGTTEEGHEVIGYMSVNLSVGDQTRADLGDSFEYGNADEVNLAPGNCHYAVFYDTGSQLPVAVASLSGMSRDDDTDHKAVYSVAFATIVGRSEDKGAFEKLKECVVILNTGVPMSELWTKNKTNLLNLTVNSPYYIDSKGKEYMTMSNVIYAEGTNKVVASQVDPTKVFESYMQAIEEAWKGNAAVTAYVERLVGKVKLRYANEAYNSGAEKIFTPTANKMIVCHNINANGIPYYSDHHANGNRYQYRIKVTGWGVNALEEECYLFRQIQPSRNYFTGWNNASLKRSYWAEDCNYYRTAYPQQFRQAVDSPEIPFYKGKMNILRNLSFAELNATDFPYNYAPENTYDFTDATFRSMNDNRLELLGGTHVIVCAELQSNIDDGVSFKSSDLYRDRTGNYYRNEKECIRALVATFNNQLESHSYLKYTYYDWNAGGGKQTLYAKTSGSYSLWINNTKVTLANVDQITSELLSDATITEGDGQRILWNQDFKIKDDSGKEVEIYTIIDQVDSKNDKKLRTANSNDIKSLIYQYIGAVDHFNDGKMYYAIPIGLIQNGNSGNSSQSSFSIFGLVRNCVYDILIHDITGVGTSVDNVNEAIIPNSTQNNERLFVSFDILDWHLTEQNVPGLVS